LQKMMRVAVVHAFGKPGRGEVLIKVMANGVCHTDLHAADGHWADSCFYVFTVAALGIALGTIASTMAQFGPLSIPVLLVMMLLSGSTTPLESMPVWLASRHACDQPDAAVRGFRSRCALSRSRFPNCLDRNSGHIRYRQRVFCGRSVPLSPRHFQRLSSLRRKTPRPY
jgi:hypothetical protein